MTRVHMVGGEYVDLKEEYPVFKQMVDAAEMHGSRFIEAKVALTHRDKDGNYVTNYKRIVSINVMMIQQFHDINFETTFEK